MTMMRTPTSRSFKQLLKATNAEEIVPPLVLCCWEAGGYEGKPPNIDLLNALPCELNHLANIRGAFDRNFDRWQSETYFILFECFRAIGLEVQSISIGQWNQMDDQQRNQAVHFVWENDVLLFSETPDWIAGIIEIDTFTKVADITDETTQLFLDKYTEQQKQCAEFDRLYIDLSSLIRYITQPNTKRIPKHLRQNIEEARIERIHSFWKFCYQRKNSLSHLLAPMVRTCLKDQIPQVKPERRRDTGILHHAVQDTFSLSVSIGETAPAEPEQTQLFGNMPQEGLQLEIPGFEFPESELVPALPFIARKTGGTGAPIADRLFANVLIEYQQSQRGMFNLSRLETTYRDVKAWLWPNGTTDPKKVLIPRLYRGLKELHNYDFLWERRLHNIIAVDTFPTMSIKPNDPLTFTIRMPKGMNTKNGALIGVEPLRIYGAQSAPKFRAWVRLAYLWDAAKIRNGGQRIYATIPEVLRNNDSYLVDAKGEVILTGDLYHTKNGWKCRQGQNPQKAWYHPQAVRTGRQVRNPQADKVPVLSDTDMVKLFYDHTERKGTDFTSCLQLSRKHAREMQNDGRVVLEVDQINKKTGIKGWKILEPHNRG